MAHTDFWLVREQDAERVANPSLWLLADASHTGGALGANRLSLAAGEPGAKPHYHRRSAEAFYVLDGALRMLVGTELVTVERGGYLVVPAGVAHAFAAAPDGIGAEVLVTIAPAIERFDYFRLLPAVLRGELSQAELDELHERYDVHFVDSPEWTVASAGR